MFRYSLAFRGTYEPAVGNDNNYGSKVKMEFSTPTGARSTRRFIYGISELVLGDDEYPIKDTCHLRCC